MLGNRNRLFKGRVETIAPRFPLVSVSYCQLMAANGTSWVGVFCWILGGSGIGSQVKFTLLHNRGERMSQRDAAQAAQAQEQGCRTDRNGLLF